MAASHPESCGVELAHVLRDQVWGQGFPAPVFDDTFSVLAQRTVGGNHSKLALARGTERFDAILFRQVDRLPPSSARRIARTSTNGGARPRCSW